MWKEVKNPRRYSGKYFPVNMDTILRKDLTYTKSIRCGAWYNACYMNYDIYNIIVVVQECLVQYTVWRYPHF